MSRLMIVAGKDFPVPWNQLKELGIDAVHQTDVPKGLPHHTTHVVAIAKMSGHVMFQQARRLAREHRLPFANATSATALIRQAIEWGIPIAVGTEVPKNAVSVRMVAPASDIVTSHPIDHVATTVKMSVPDEPALPAPVPAEEKKEEDVVANKKWKAPDYTEVVLLLTGLPSGPYRNWDKIRSVANLYREIVGAKRNCKKASPVWSKDGFHRVMHQAVEDGIVSGDSHGAGWTIAHDPKVKLTLISRTASGSPESGLAPIPVKAGANGEAGLEAAPPEPSHHPLENGFYLMKIPSEMMRRMGVRVVVNETGIDDTNAAKLMKSGYISTERWLQAAEKWAVGILDNLLK